MVIPYMMLVGQESSDTFGPFLVALESPIMSIRLEYVLQRLPLIHHFHYP